jgi:hypothetical protein
MEAYVERIKANAENLAKEIFPKKALELDDLINVISIPIANFSWDYGQYFSLCCKSPEMSTENYGCVFNSADFPKPEDFIVHGGLEKSDMNQADYPKENLEEVSVDICLIVASTWLELISSEHVLASSNQKTQI